MIASEMNKSSRLPAGFAKQFGSQNGWIVAYQVDIIAIEEAPNKSHISQRALVYKFICNVCLKHLLCQL
jgi:hypothetical protein